MTASSTAGGTSGASSRSGHGAERVDIGRRSDLVARCLLRREVGGSPETVPVWVRPAAAAARAERIVPGKSFAQDLDGDGAAA